VHAGPFHFVLALLNARLSVDESFSRITHECFRPLGRWDPASAGLPKASAGWTAWRRTPHGYYHYKIAR
jgi:hypothetical protein